MKRVWAWRVVLSSIPMWSFSPSLFNIGLALSTVPWVPQAGDPLHSPKRKFSVFLVAGQPPNDGKW